MLFSPLSVSVTDGPLQASTEGGEEGSCTTHQLGRIADSLPFPTPSLSLISSPLMMHWGNVIVFSEYLPLAE